MLIQMHNNGGVTLGEKANKRTNHSTVCRPMRHRSSLLMAISFRSQKLTSKTSNQTEEKP